MWQLLQELMRTWIKAQFRGNPLVENTGAYLTQVAAALRVGIIGAGTFIILGVVGSAVFVIGVIKQWF